VEVFGQMATSRIVTALLAHEDPSVRYLTRRDVLGEPLGSAEMEELRALIRTSARVERLLDGRDGRPGHTYAKFRGAHWVALALTELAHPGGDNRVLALVDETLNHWTAPRYAKDAHVDGVIPRHDAVPVIAGLARRCASQQGAALLIATHFGVDDDRVRFIAKRLGDWQWPDGGWNCDSRPEARMSSVHETLLPLRGLAAYAGSGDGRVAAAREFLLERRVAFRRSTGEPIAPAVVQLHYPPYWHYDVLAGLGGLAESGGLEDERCEGALDLIESRRLGDRGWPADARWYRMSGTGSRMDSVDWGPVHRQRANPWVTIRALTVLRKAGRL